jgi:lipopolysaccharide/colanic/teichoic acid biosynthesis glycosyltransferase
MSLIGPRPTLRYQVEQYTSASGGGSRCARDHRLGADPRPRVAAVGRADRARRLVRRAPLAAHDLLILLRTPLALFGGTYKGETGGWRKP